jgi:uncharacterized protein YgiB involved in biofilm formation
MAKFAPEFTVTRIFVGCVSGFILCHSMINIAQLTSYELYRSIDASYGKGDPL